MLLLTKFKRAIERLDLKSHGIEVLLVGEDGLPILSTLSSEEDKLAAMCTVIAVSSERNMQELGKVLDYVVISSRGEGGIVIARLSSSYLVLIYPSSEKLGLTLFFMRKLKKELGEVF